ncbi:MAG: hypothetical protein ACI810_002735 [Gammaproteobacteria bacterium]|jgi:hypothetical protein
MGDMCDDGDDADGILDGVNNCPMDYNPAQTNVCEICFPIESAYGKFILICV